MHRIEIPDRKIVKEIPSEISEMTRDQYLYFVMQILDYMAGMISLDTFRIKLIRYLLEIRVNARFHTLKSEEQESINGEIYRLSLLCDSFFREEIRDGNPVKIANLSFVKNLVPEICDRYYGPDDGLADITFCEYRFANSYFRAYMKDADENDLNHLIAVLYRPRKSMIRIRRLLPGFNGQERVPFTSKSNPLKLKKRVDQISKLPKSVRYGIFLWYSGCEEFLVKGKPEVDGHEIDLSELYKNTSGETTQANIGLVGILYTLAESNVFGPIENTDNQGLYDVMARLYQVVMQNREMEAKFKKDGSGKDV